MPTSGSTFTDWQQVEDQRSLIFDEDFSWSDASSGRKRRATAVAERAERPRPRRILNSDPLDERPTIARDAAPARAERSAQAPVQQDAAELDERWDGQAQAQVRRTDAEFEAARRQWTATYVEDPGAQTFDRDDAASYATARVVEDRSGALDLRHSSRRTVVITGRGDSRYTIAQTRRRASELRFHERSGFNPDRAALWAVLLGIALLLGCIAH